MLLVQQPIMQLQRRRTMLRYERPLQAPMMLFAMAKPAESTLQRSISCIPGTLSATQIMRTTGRSTTR